MYFRNIKKLTFLGIVLISCVSLSEDKMSSSNEINIESKEIAQTTRSVENTSQTQNISNTSVLVVSKSDSFMTAFGMGDSNVVAGGESGGEANSNSSSTSQSSSAIAGSVITSGTSSLTNIQNTPYMPK
ncbi:MAG: hypothetical protein ACRCXX_06000 [Cetobacterium sp.]|uniref:hypothetical protein n=1 Tax=Cetobacterium sp. TaxID=2071632 RepID=UPI003F3C8782